MTKTVKKHPKRYGHHQKHTQHFLKTYWPYMPLTLIVSAMALLGVTQHTGKGVLSYATGLSQQQLLQDTNQQRVANQVAPLRLNDKLSAAAQAKANDMASRNYWSHNTPDGNPPWTFITKAGYTYQKAGENLAYGFTSSSGAITGWMNSPSHRENLLDTQFNEVGFGFANVENYQDKGPETIVVAEYGTPQATLAATPSAGIPLNATYANPPSTLGAVSQAEPASRTIAVSQLLAGGRVPGVNLLIAIFASLGLGFLLIKHSLALRRMWLHGERFALHHPLFDITIVSFLGLCAMLSQTAGFIR